MSPTPAAPRSQAFFISYTRNEEAVVEVIETRVDRTLDCRDTLCPGPIVEVSRALRGLGRGQVLEVIATDPGFLPDVEAFTRRTGHALLRVEQGDGEVRAWLRCRG